MSGQSVSMSRTQHHALPFMAPAQAQKHMTLNESLIEIDRRLHIHLQSVSHAEPPSTLTLGDRYGIPPSATGDWSGEDGSIAEWEGNTWILLRPKSGWLAYVADQDGLFTASNNDWLRIGKSETTVEQLGVNTEADGTNRLAVRSSSVYLGADDSGTIDRTMNRATDSDNSRLYFKTNDIVRAEVGYTGDDQFRIKTTPDGEVFATALAVEANGHIGLSGEADSVYSVRINADSPGADGIKIDNLNTSTNASANLILSAAGNHYFKFQLYGSGSLYAFTNAAMIMGTYAPHPIYFKTDTIDRMVIGSDGKIGIGTASRTAALNVGGGIRYQTAAAVDIPSASSEGAGTMRAISDINGFRMVISDGSVWRDLTIGSAI